MFPDSPYAVPRSSYERPVPLVLVDPCDNPDVAIYVRHEWIPYILGSLKQLLLQTTWDTQDPEALNLVQARAMLLLSCVGTSGAPTQPKIQGPEFSMADICDVLRWNENGELEVNCCGEWQLVPGSENAPAPGMRQPAGQPRPPAEGCKEFEVSLKAGDKWIVPFAVNAGDTIEISNVQGIWSDFGNIFWNYPNGDLYGLGQRIPYCDHKVSDLSADFCHMRLIGLLGESTYVDAYNTTITVPGGTEPTSLQFMANNGFPSPGGTITFHVKVCSGATPPAAEWCQFFDFTLSDFGWVEAPDDPYGTAWAAGVGWQGGNNGAVFGGRFRITLPAQMHGTSFVLTLETDEPHSSSDSSHLLAIVTDSGGGGSWFDDPNEFNLDTPVIERTADFDVSPGAFMQIDWYSSLGTTFVNIKSLEIHGVGTNPFGLSNC